MGGRWFVRRGIAWSLLLATLVGCRTSSGTLTDIDGVAELQNQFNRDAGSTRIVLLMSPTGPACVAGARWVQESVLQTHPDANLRVYAIWFAMYATDLRERWPSNILTDARVRHWWDEDKQVGRWYAERMRQMEERLAPGSAALGGTILWDSYLVYGPDARWDDAPSDLRRWGRPIFATRDSLSEALDAAVRRTE